MQDAINWDDEDLTSLVLTVTAGSDVSSGHVNVQQEWAEGDDIADAELSLSVTMFLLIRMESASGKYNWTNPQPQSPRFCRPLQLSLEKGTTESILADYSKLRSEIDNLQPHSFCLSNEKRAIMTFRVFTTLYNEKCVNALVKNRCSSNCPMCYCTQAQVDSKSITGEPFPGIGNNFQFGMGLLHVTIRSMEFFLQLTYKKPILDEGWIVRDLKTGTKRRDIEGSSVDDPGTVTKDKEKVVDRKKIVMENKKRVKEKTYAAVGVRVDQVRRGFGSSNTGSVARRCFADPEKFSKALEINETLVKKVSLISRLFRCKENLRLDEVRRLCYETHDYSFRVYGEAYVNPTLHKALIHGADIAEQFPLLVAFSSEDALETWHKIFRRAMVYHARQCEGERNQKVMASPKIWLRISKSKSNQYVTYPVGNLDTYSRRPAETEEEDNEEDVLSQSENDGGVTDDEAME
ncbi:hypothetical protein QAD02_021335 [Eretmocerus hayati]|uniref:Uncharacterized protein n=1 Tax=Eretmocerus hayati TaxID=131215 RepID=A0ACC2PT51_9HYME|nr:hypothetical protein QAD02_021335 [Eretmocerus hayati]